MIEDINIDVEAEVSDIAACPASQTIGIAIWRPQDHNELSKTPCVRFPRRVDASKSVEQECND